MSATVPQTSALHAFADVLGGERVLTSDGNLAAEQYSWNDHAYMRFCETIKDAVDPKGILTPGKQGIWPKSMRGK